MKTLAQRRRDEIEKYIDAYDDPRYGMGKKRKEDVQKLLAVLPAPLGSLFDFGTGRGETLNFAACLGFFPVVGSEVVPSLFNIDYKTWTDDLADLPIRFREGPPAVLECDVNGLQDFRDGCFDHVTCFDVLEHLLEEDIEPCLRELYRIARVSVSVSAADFSHVYKGVELHISKRPEEAWFRLIRGIWPGYTRRIGKIGPSDGFQVFK